MARVSTPLKTHSSSIRDSMSTAPRRAKESCFSETGAAMKANSAREKLREPVNGSMLMETFIAVNSSRGSDTALERWNIMHQELKRSGTKVNGA